MLKVSIKEGVYSGRKYSMFVYWWDDPVDIEDMMMEEKRDNCWVLG